MFPRNCSSGSGRSATSRRAGRAKTGTPARIRRITSTRPVADQPDAAGLLALRQGRAADALPFFLALRKRGADSFELRYYLGRTYAALGRAKEAAAEYARGRGETARLRRRVARAGREPGRARRSTGCGRGLRSAGGGRAGGRARTYRARAGVPRSEPHGGRGPGDARGDRLDPGPAAYWNALGTVLGASGQMARRRTRVRRGGLRESGNGLFVYNHAIALEQLGRREDAIARYRRAAELGYARRRRG